MKPLLACSKIPDLGDLRYPLIGSPKIDGIRCLTFAAGVPKSRTLKEIPNEHIRSCFKELGLPGLDGELVIPDAANFGEVSSAIMSERGEPEFEYHAFDRWNASGGYLRRMMDLVNEIERVPPWLIILAPELVETEAEVLAYEEEMLGLGYEGIMLRAPLGAYKHGRSTLNEGLLLKLKRFSDSEALVIGWKEEQTNTNVAGTDELGHTKRSTAKAGMVGASRIGSLHVRDLETGVEFNVSARDMAEADEMWTGRDQLAGQIVKYKYQGHGGKERPRFPILLGFRHPDDMGDPE